MNPNTTVEYGPSLLDMLGIFPAILTLVAICVGILAVALRKRTANIAIAHVLLAVGCFGLGTTAWRMHSTNSLLRPDGAVDPTSWLNDLGYAWMASGIVLPAVGVGYLLIAVSWLMTRPTAE